MGKRRSKKGTNAAAWFYGTSFHQERRQEPRKEAVTEKVATLELPPAAYRPLPHEEQGAEALLPASATGVFSGDFTTEEPTKKTVTK